jgi:hypothetical protein
MTGRRVTTAVTMTVLFVVLVAMAVFGFSKLTEPLPGRGATASKECTGAEKEVQTFLKRKEVQVSVFNAGSKDGQASRALEKIEEAGFRAGNAGNAPRSADVRRALVWTTEQDDPAAELVARALGKRTQVEVTRTDLGPGVDVLVGNRFQGLDPGAPNRIKLAQPVQTCVQVD